MTTATIDQAAQGTQAPSSAQEPNNATIANTLRSLVTSGPAIPQLGPRMNQYFHHALLNSNRARLRMDSMQNSPDPGWPLVGDSIEQSLEGNTSSIENARLEWCRSLYAALEADPVVYRDFTTRYAPEMLPQFFLQANMVSAIHTSAAQQIISNDQIQDSNQQSNQAQQTNQQLQSRQQQSQQGQQQGKQGGQGQQVHQPATAVGSSGGTTGGSGGGQYRKEDGSA